MQFVVVVVVVVVKTYLREPVSNLFPTCVFTCFSAGTLRISKILGFACLLDYLFVGL